MKNYLLFIYLILFSLIIGSKAQAFNTILLLGDSVSASYRMQQHQGWVHLLNQKLATQNAPYTILNASISGETTSGGLSRLPGILAENSIDHLIIELGGNDGLRGYKPEAIKNNLLQMVKIAQEKNIPVTLMQIKITPNYGPRYNKMFEAVFKEVAAETNATLLPFFMEQVALNPELMMQDGIHPNVKAQPIIADYVAEQLKNLMK
ncbi:arylesterase [Thalassotalea hakodatensis]|uniref:arylesterase n=1 Tax=Thalassotalea hakodatensis TaxID=3030492 RepID=UPI0025723C28|nr:arylesterase [Thalassotalea hakodatensis]